MRIVILVIVFTAISFASAFPSEIVEIQLPDLLGYYPCSTKTCDFVLDTAPTEVYAVSIRFSGSVNVGEYYCILTVPPATGPYPSPMEFSVSMRDTVSGDLWVANCVSEDKSGSFEFTLQFEPSPAGEPTWEFILLGGGTVVFHAHALALIPECWHEVLPDATIEEAALLIDGDFPVAVETHTWGSIKSLFK